jgi:hypothetical protein
MCLQQRAEEMCRFYTRCFCIYQLYGVQSVRTLIGRHSLPCSSGQYKEDRTYLAVVANIKKTTYLAVVANINMTELTLQ